MRVKTTIALLLGTISVFCGQISHSISYPIHLGEIRESILFHCGLPTHPTPGEPQMPYERYRFLLPSDISPASVSVTLRNSNHKTVYTNSTISPAAPYISDNEEQFHSDEAFTDGKKDAIYLKDALFPRQNILQYRLLQKRQFTIVEITLLPYQYNPITKEIKGLTSGEICIDYKENSGRKEIYPIPSSFIKSLKKEVHNFDEMIHSYTDKAPVQRGGNYHIITTNTIKQSLTKLDDFITQKTNRGFTVTLVTEEEWGGGSGNEAADNLRAWLEEHYLTDNIEYVLLIGNPNPSSGDMAMKIAHAYYSGKKAPTDFYFSELSGNWDADGDGKYGETDDLNTKKSGGIDAEGDVLVGRIPYYSGDAAKVDAILEKTMLYESADINDIAWRNNLLLAMDGYYGSEGPTVGEAIYTELPSQWDAYRIYCNSKGSPDKSSTSMTNVTNAWAPGSFGVVSWLTHGKADAAMHIMDVTHAKQLSNVYPSIVMMGSCLNGKPDVPYNLAYTILQQGGIAVVAGSETTIYRDPMGDFKGSSYNHGFIYTFTSKLTKGRELVIEALNNTRNESDMGCWKNYCAFNLYGDPTVGIDVAGVAVPTKQAVHQTSSIELMQSGNRVQLSVPYAGKTHLVLYNMKGQELLTESFMKNTSIDMTKHNLAKGIYSMQLTMGSQVSTQKLILN